MNPCVRILLFSRDRAFQLEATLRSLYGTMEAAVVPEVFVVYRVTGSVHRAQYVQLKSQYPQVCFVEETDFQIDVLGVLEGSDFILFSVDDCIFLRPWSLDSMVESLQSHEASLGFSMRLGKNIHFCYPFQCEQLQPEFEDYGNGILSFVWSQANYDFGYPLEVSSSLYRTADILVCLRDSKFTRPNELERELASRVYLFSESRPLLSLFSLSVAFACPVNIVQDHKGNLFGQEFAIDAEELTKRFDEGLRMNLDFTKSFIPVSCHQEIKIAFEYLHGKKAEQLNLGHSRRWNRIYKKCDLDLSHYGMLLLPGVPKCGTSSMFSDLIQFDEVISHANKEINLPLDSYSMETQWFPLINPTHKKQGWLIDGSQNYCWDLEHRDLEFLSKQSFREKKVILMFRNPVLRSISNYEMNRKQHGWKDSFSAAWKEYVSEKGQKVMGDYLDFYRRNVYLFGEENVKAIISEEYFCNRLEILQDVRVFLGFRDTTNAFDLQVISPLNDQPQQYQMDDELYSQLVAFFEPNIKAFERALGIKTSWMDYRV